MRWLRLLLVLPLGGAVASLGCGTSAIGIEDCRNIEVARCQAARGCHFGIDTNSDEDVCQRFARDNCLHGTVVQAPTTGAVTDCVASIKAAGACATKGTKLADCHAVGAVTKSTASTCDVIQNPEVISACEFLTQQPTPAPTTTATAAADAGTG